MTDAEQADSDPAQQVSSHGGHGGHGWMMIACCIPMLVIGVLLVATGVVSPGFLVFAVLCTAMMAVMMRGMGGGLVAQADRSTPDRKLPQA